MPDNSKITLKQLKYAMNKVKEYIDEQIQGISPNPPEVPCTSIVLNKNTLSFTTNDTQTLVATVTPSNTTDTVIWSVSPSGIVTVANGIVTPVANGSCTITATCGSKSATCNVTVSGLNEVTESVIYELPQETVFNGSNICIETGIALLGDEYLNTDWTILFDFTDNGSSTQASIFDCEDGASPFPGVCVKFYNGNVIASIYGKAVTLGSQDTNRHKFVMTKSGNTFTSYDENMSQLDVKTFDSLATVAQKLLLGCSENATGYRGPYMKGTIHRFKVVEGVMSREDCLAWMA